MAATDDHLVIGAAVQKAWIETNEHGTEAAAVTTVQVEEVVSARVDERPPKPVIFHANHPFVYFIRDTESGVILFAGRVRRPST
jgi:serpin B